MKTPFTLFILTLCLIATGCTKDSAAAANPAEQAAKEKAGNDCEGCIDSMTTVVTKSDADKTKSWMVEEFTPISTIMADFAGFEGKRVKIKGEAVSLCAKRGCFVNLKSDGAEATTFRVKVEDGVIFFPAEAKGHEVVAEGVVEKEIIPVEKLIEIYTKKAEDKGETFDPSKVTKPLIRWHLKGIIAKCQAAKWAS